MRLFRLPFRVNKQAFSWRATQNTDKLMPLFLLCPALVGMLGLAVMWGWVVNSMTIVQIRPAFAPMQFNTALCFVLSSVGFLSLYAGRRHLCMAAAAAVGFMTLITLLQYVFQVNFGIDTFLMTPFSTVNTSSAGRMAPNTAIAFILLSFSLFLCAFGTHVNNRRALVAAVLGSLCFALGGVPLLGYLSGVEAAYTWNNQTRMAVHTGSFFVMLSIVVMAYAWTKSRRRTLWLPIPIGIAFVAIAFSMASAVRIQEKAHFENALQAQADNISEITKVKLSELTNSLSRMRGRWEVAGGIPQSVWQSDAQSYLEGFPYLLALEKLDRNLQLEWIEPFADNERLIGLNFNTEEKRRKAIQQAIQTRTPFMTESLTLMQGGEGFLYFIPLFVHHQFDGMLVAVFNTDNFFRIILDQSHFGRYFITVSEHGKVIFSNVPEGYVFQKNTQKTTVFKQDDVEWSLTVIPTPELLASHMSHIYLAVFIVGLFMAFLVTLCTYLALRWRYSHQALEESTRLNNAVLSSTSYMIVATDTSGQVIVFNSAAERCLGYLATEIEYKQTPVLWHDIGEINQRAADLSREFGETVEPGFNVFTRRTNAGLPDENVWTLIRKDGSRFPAYLSVTTLRDNQQQIVGYLGILEDITERRQLEQMAADIALEEQKRLLDIVAIQRDVAHMHHDLQSAMNLIAERIRTITHAESSVIEMLEGEEMVYSAASGKAASHLGFRLSAATSLSGRCVRENRTLKCDNAETDERVDKAACLKIGAISMVVVPLTREKRAVGVLKVLSSRPNAFNDKHVATLELMAGVLSAAISDAVTNDHLLQSEETFRLAIENASIGMALVEPGGRWLKVNQALCDILGYDRLELMQNNFQSITHPDDLEADLEYIRRVLADEIKSYQIAKRYYHKNGKIVWVQLSISLVRHSNGDPHYFIAQIQDITEQKEIERIKSEFISIVSHELRTPLTSIRGALGLILGALSEDLPLKVKGLIDIAHNNCERLILLINDILDIDKIAVGQMRFDMKEESLAKVTQQAIDANQAYAYKFNTTIASEPIDESLMIEVDSARYIQVLSNLLSNAAKFSPKGVPIIVSATRFNNRIRVSIRDSGPGIPEEFRSRIFGKFSQADSSVTRAQGGTGLGLHITKQIMEQMKGRIGFDTETGKGTTFWIEFPLAKQAMLAADTIGALSDAPSHFPLILHVEDDADLSEVIAQSLHDKAQILTATTLRQAEEYLRQRHFSMIILDIGLPDGNGLSLLDRLPMLSAEPLPVVILSADSPTTEIHQKVAAVMVKSRLYETKIVETIWQILEEHQGK